MLKVNKCLIILVFSEAIYVPHAIFSTVHAMISAPSGWKMKSEGQTDSVVLNRVFQHKVWPSLEWNAIWTIWYLHVCAAVWFINLIYLCIFSTF